MHTGLAGQLRYLVFQNFLPVLVVAQLLLRFGLFAAEIGKVGFGLRHSITLLYKIKSQTISIKADHLAVETYLIFAVQANLNRKYTVFLFRVEVTMVLLNDTIYIF